MDSDDIKQQASELREKYRSGRPLTSSFTDEYPSAGVPDPRIRQALSKGRYMSLTTNAFRETSDSKNPVPDLQDHLKQQIAVLTKLNKQQSVNIDELTHQLNDKTQKEVVYIKSIQNEQDMSQSLNSEVQHLRQELANATNKNSEQEVEIKRLKRQVSDKAEEVTELERCLTSVTAASEQCNLQLEFVVENFNKEKMDLLNKFEDFKEFCIAMLKNYEQKNNAVLKVLEQCEN